MTACRGPGLARSGVRDVNARHCCKWALNRVAGSYQLYVVGVNPQSRGVIRLLIGWMMLTAH
jgi:hypothetical protein